MDTDDDQELQRTMIDKGEQFTTCTKNFLEQSGIDTAQTLTNINSESVYPNQRFVLPSASSTAGKNGIAYTYIQQQNQQHSKNANLNKNNLNKNNGDVNGTFDVHMQANTPNSLSPEKKRAKRQRVSFVNKVSAKSNTALLPASSNRFALLDLDVSPSFSHTNVVPEFNDDMSVGQWVAHFENVVKMFRLTSSVAKTLICCKLKGNAEMRLMSKENYATIKVAALLNEMKEIFKTNTSKLELRKKLQNRRWLNDELFTKYFNDKILQSKNLDMETELLEHLIAGISNTQLCN